MSLALLIVSALTAAGLSFALTPLTIRIAARLGAMDEPSDRKVHATAIPRLGGMAVILAAVIALIVQMSVSGENPRGLSKETFWLGLALGMVPIAAVSLRDDIRSVRPLPKLIAQIIGASVAVWFGIRLAPEIHLFDSDNVRAGAEEKAPGGPEEKGDVVREASEFRSPTERGRAHSANLNPIDGVGPLVTTRGLTV